jgi:putative ABC transport system permease protein
MKFAAPSPRLLVALFQLWTWRMAWRDSRSQRRKLLLFSLSIVWGIGALVALHSLKSSVERAVELQANALLGSDLQITSRTPFTPSEIQASAAESSEISLETSFSSMLYFPTADAGRMVQVRGIDGRYPFYGSVETEPSGGWSLLQGSPGVLLEAALLDQFGVRVGDRVRLGALELPILGVVRKPAPRSSRFNAFAPEIYVHLDQLPATGLTESTSLLSHHLHLKLKGEGGPTSSQLKERWTATGWNMQTPGDRRDSLGRTLENFEQFLSLIALVALVLGAVGVAGALRVHVRRRLTSVAILRCLGCPESSAFAVYVAQALALGSLGSLLGAVLGVALHAGVLTFYQETLPLAVDTRPVWSSVFLTTAAGFTVCGAFALSPLLAVRRIAPAAALRTQGAAVSVAPGSRWVQVGMGGMLVAVVLGVLVLGGSEFRRALGMTAGLGMAFAVLAATARGLVWSARRSLRPAWPYVFRQGISNLHRPHNQTLLFLLSLGLGTFLLLTVLLARDSMLQRISTVRASDSPSVYLVDVQSDQREAVAGLIRSLDLPVLESAPIVTMRIASIKDIPVARLREEGTIPGWVLRREFRSSYRAGTNDTETIVAGQWWPQGRPHAGVLATGERWSLVSLEEELARDLRVGVGDELVVDVAGVPLRARVGSIREVDWSRLNLNFFMLFPEGVLEDAPGFHIVTTRLPEGISSGRLQRELARDFPNVSAIDLALILETVRGILDRVGTVIHVLSGFVLVSGLIILAGVILNSREDRVRESVLLRTLGASRSQVRGILWVEYAALGLLSATAGVLLAVVAHAVLSLWVFKTSPWPDPVWVGLFLLGPVVLSVTAGLLLSRGVCSEPPLVVLRSQTA